MSTGPCHCSQSSIDEDFPEERIRKGSEGGIGEGGSICGTLLSADNGIA